MPWKASSVMEERLRFVARLLDGEAMTEVCREFGISRKTGYKIFDRYREHGLEALSDRSRRPVRYANQLPQQLETLIVRPEARYVPLYVLHPAKPDTFPALAKSAVIPAAWRFTPASFTSCQV